MNSRIKPIKYSKNLCFKCLQEKEDIHEYIISNRGYGSGFDSFNSTIQLCDECNFTKFALWINEKPSIVDNYYEDYKHEENIFKFIENLPIQAKELFENQCASGSCVYQIDSQDWIDIELGIADKSIYEKYNILYNSEGN